MGSPAGSTLDSSAGGCAATASDTSMVGEVACADAGSMENYASTSSAAHVIAPETLTQLRQALNVPHPSAPTRAPSNAAVSSDRQLTSILRGPALTIVPVEGGSEARLLLPQQAPPCRNLSITSHSSEQWAGLSQDRPSWGASCPKERLAVAFSGTAEGIQARAFCRLVAEPVLP